VGGWEEFMEREGCEHDDEGNSIDEFPTGDEPFGDYITTGYPEWLAESMLSWFPKDLIKKYGSVEPPGFDSDETLYLPPEAAEDVAANCEHEGAPSNPSQST
jgi:hypothetical protein